MSDFSDTMFDTLLVDSRVEGHEGNFSHRLHELTRVHKETYRQWSIAHLPQPATQSPNGAFNLLSECRGTSTNNAMKLILSILQGILSDNDELVRAS
jgi:hypothetical protein